MSRPIGTSAGIAGLVLAWCGGAAVARLTGSTPVVIVLATGLVAAVGALVAGWVALRRVGVDTVVLPTLATAGEEVPVTLGLGGGGRAPNDDADDRTRSAPGRRRPGAPLWIELIVDGDVVARGWASGDRLSTTATFPRRTVATSADVVVRSAGVAGLVWWERRHRVAIDECTVAPRPSAGAARVERRSQRRDGDLTGEAGAVAGEIDGVRPWREGDSERYVHWSSSLRSGQLVVHDRRAGSDHQVIVRARHGMPDPDLEAAAVRGALDGALRVGTEVFVAVDDGEPVPVGDPDAAARWTARAELGERPVAAGRGRSWTRAAVWRREPESTARLSARWWAAASTMVSLAMLLGGLGSGLIAIASTIVAVAGGAAVSGRTVTTGEDPPMWARIAVLVGATGGLALVVSASGRDGGLLSLLRGPLPHVLVILIALHGFEARDRRTIRVGLGISAVVLMYAAALRVDDHIGWWLLAFGVCFAVALRRLADPTLSPASAGRWGRGSARRGSRPGAQPSHTASISGWWGRWSTRLALTGGVAVATLAALALVPVPSGPARLTLPTLVEDAEAVGAPGSVAAADGTPATGEGEVDRTPAGQAGGYTGFADSMDTSVRGALSDEVVMRVRAPEPDFWRGQTFARFDGRRWYADEELGSLRQGALVDVPPTPTDVVLPDGAAAERFVQTFYLERDAPNVVFHAYRPVETVIDADVWTRPDGSLRASTTLPAGSIYTVVSMRPVVDAGRLRAQGAVGNRLSELGRLVLGDYLEVPESTTAETIALATELAADATSTYDVVRAYEAWLGEHVVYDLDAPVPAPGQDAVHDVLFESQRGFCEQISSALAIMLRTQGVPTRIATGYVPGDRDEIAGVFEVRGSDAHAWVEVWFPETGWQAFDPTASVPLSADSGIDSVGADLVTAAGAYVRGHPAAIAGIVASAILLLGAARLLSLVRLRRERGRWGVLQERFTAAAVRRGAVPGSSNRRLAASWGEGGEGPADAAERVAVRLDQVAFDPVFDDDGADADRAYAETRRLVAALGRDR